MRWIPILCTACLLLAGYGLQAAAAETEAGGVQGSGAAASDSRLRQVLAQAQQDRSEGRLYDALEGYRQALVMAPNLTRARLELALTYYALLDTDNARIQARYVLHDPELTDAVQASVRRLLDAIDALELQLAPGHQWKRELALRAGTDDNVNFGPSDELIDIGGDIFRIAPGFLPREDTFQAYIGRLTHRYQLDGRARIGQRAASRYWESQLTLYHTDYRHEDELEVSFASLSSGYGLRAPKAWRSTLRLRADQILFGGENYLTQWSLLPTIVWLADRMELRWESTLMRRMYAETRNVVRNSDYLTTGLTWGNKWQDGALALLLGAKWFDERTKDSYYNNDGYEVTLALSQKLDERFDLYGKYARREAVYEGVSTLFATNREETRQRGSLGFVYRFGPGILQDVRLRLDHTRTVRDSTITLYEYERNVSSLLLEYAF